MIDEYDLFLVSKSLFKAVEEGISIEIVVISTSNKKSMKLVNLCKRLIDLNVQIYWRIDKDLFVKEDYFGIFDKEYLVSKLEQPNFEDAEGLIRFKNDFFNGLALDSKKLSMFDGDIHIEFESNRSIIYPKEEIVLSWEVLNAHEVQIEPLDKKLDTKGVKNILIEETHESPLVMLIPLFLLGIGALISGFLFKETIIGHDSRIFWQTSIFFLNEINHSHIPLWLLLITPTLVVISIPLSFYLSLIHI